MSDQNSFHFIGRLTRHAELKYVGQNNTTCATFSLAVNRWNRAKNQEDVSYFDLSYYGAPAANLIRYLEKGKQVSVKGFCKQDRWEKDGEKHSRVSFVCTELQFLGGGKGGESGYGEEKQTSSAYSAPLNNLPSAPDVASPGMQDNFDNMPEDIPF